MEKRSPQYPLAHIKKLVAARKVRATFSALAGASALSIDFEGMLAVLLAISARDFYKSMTTHADHRVWQDVYRPNTSAGDVYLKLIVIEDVLIISFKEL